MNVRVATIHVARSHRLGYCRRENLPNFRREQIVNGTQEETKKENLPPSRASAPKERMSPKDKAGIGFSMIALVLSAASFYTSNLRIDDDTSARIVDVTVEGTTRDDPSTGYKNGNINLKIAIVNAGNRPAIITNAVYQLSDRPTLETGGFGGDLATSPQTLPMLIAAKDIRLVNFQIPIRHLLSEYSNGAKVTPNEAVGSGDLRRFFAGIRYEAVDSRGALHSTWSGMQVSIEVSQNRWERISGPLNAKTYSLTPLLK